MIRRFLVGCVVACALSLALAPAAFAADPVDLENATCPVKGTPAKATVTETYKGMTVHFCCTHCAAKFKKDPTPYLGALRADPAVAKKMEAALASEAAPAGAPSLEGWSEPAKAALAKTTEKLGQPSSTEADRLVWEDKAPWKRVVVHREGAPIEHVVSYKVEGEVDLSAWKEHAVYDATTSELSARHDREELNVLALNLANEIATKKSDVAAATKAWTEGEKAVKAGKAAPLATSLAFEPSKASVDAPK